MKLTLGFSPCPNDTFIFDALIHHKIDTEGLVFEVQYQDVETLNTKAFRQELDICKLSYHAFAHVVEDYQLLDAGSALGFGVGPLLIAKNEALAQELKKQLDKPFPFPDPLKNLRVAIPGRYTTANFLLGMAFPQLQNKQEIIFSEIEAALIHENVDLGLIIHENRFTYADKGLYQVLDLGEFWEKNTKHPIPLGGIAVKRNLDEPIKQKINRVLRKSVEFAFAHPKSGLDFIRSHAQEMDEAIMYQHINLYVNAYSIDLGTKGKAAIRYLFDQALALKLIPKTKKTIFVSSNE